MLQQEEFADFVVKHGVSMRRVAIAITRDAAVAEEAVQETWLALLRGIGGFEGRSSLKTWVFRILVNRARTLAARESRSITLSGEWTTAVADWRRSPEDALLDREMRGVVLEAVAALPAAQREVITLRDIEGWSAADVTEVLRLTDANQRVLLHRARVAVRRAVMEYCDGCCAATS